MSRTAKITVEFRTPGAAGVESDEDEMIGYGPNEVPVKIGTTIVAVDLEHFFMALDENDPLRLELGEKVAALQVLRA